MSIAQLFQEKSVVFSCEVFPPKKTSPIDTVYRTLDQLQDLRPDYISVTFGAGGSAGDNLTGRALPPPSRTSTTSPRWPTCPASTIPETRWPGCWTV